MYVKDLNGKHYEVIEINERSTLLKDPYQNATIRIKNHDWDSLNFIKP